MAVTPAPNRHACPGVLDDRFVAMTTLRVLIADDHPLFRKGMHALLKSMPDIELVGEAKSGKEAVSMATAQQPDVVLMDLQMPDGSGLAATREPRAGAATA